MTAHLIATLRRRLAQAQAKAREGEIALSVYEANRRKLEARDAVIRRQTDLLDRAAEALSERHAELRAAIRAELKSERR